MNWPSQPMRIHSESTQRSGANRQLNELGLASAVAHEMRRLLTPAKAYAELALTGPPLSTEASQALVAILKATQACESVLEALVASGGSEESAIADVSSVAHCTGLATQHCTVAAGVHVSMSPTRLSVVLSNLVANGLRACGDSGLVQILADHSSTGNTVLIKVIDSGVGMSPGQVSAATKAFVSFAAGSGIGLALCQHLVEEAGGRMWITSAESRGTCVTLELPAAAADLKRSA